MKLNRLSILRFASIALLIAAVIAKLYIVLRGAGGSASDLNSSGAITTPEIPSRDAESSTRRQEASPPRQPETQRHPKEQGNPEIQAVLSLPPHIAYQKFLERAETGDARAQLMLTEILDRCRHSSVQSEEALSRLERRGEMPTDMLAYYRENLEQCTGLYDMLEEYDLDTLWAFWMEEAADKLAVARIALSLNSLEAEYSDELYQQLQAGISATGEDWIQQRVARQAAFAFFRSFVEPTQYDGATHDAGYYLRSDDSLAWDYLMCEHSVHCDLKAMEQQVSDHYYEYQISDMRKRAKELDRALRDGDWERLGLRLDTD